MVMMAVVIVQAGVLFVCVITIDRKCHGFLLKDALKLQEKLLQVDEPPKRYCNVRGSVTYVAKMFWW
jgi:hypothetical protein